MLKNFKSVILNGLLLSACGLSTQAQAFVGINISIDTPPPPIPANVVVVAPQGYEECYMTSGFWEGSVWIPAHQECIYEGAYGPRVWVSGYWGCPYPGRGGHCNRWKWYGNHWSRTVHHHGRGYIGPGYHHSRHEHGDEIVHEHGHQVVHERGHEIVHEHGPKQREEITVRHEEPRYTHGHDVEHHHH